jgi:hypothetical protein
MNYSIYFILTLLLAHSVGLSSIKLDEERIQRLFNMMQSHVGECIKEEGPYPFYNCPSRFWPELLHNFVPTIKLMEGWIKQKIGAGGDIWVSVLKHTGYEIVTMNEKGLLDIRDEVTTWLLLNRHLKFDLRGFFSFQWKCITEVLDSLTALDLERLSMLSYGGNSDRFDEINEIVNDPMKARLLDGLKRAARNHSEMSLMLRSLRHLVQRDRNDDIKYAAFNAQLDISNDTPIGQLRASAVPVFDFTKDEELVRLLRLLFQTREHDDRNELEESFPPFLPNRDYLINFLVDIHDDKGVSRDCKMSLGYRLTFLDNSGKRDQIIAQDECVMRKLATISDGFFEEFLELSEKEQKKLNDMLYHKNLPKLS